MRDVRLLLSVCALSLLLAAASEAASSPVRATMTTSTTQALVDTPWRYTIVVRNGAGQPLAARARLQILLDGVVVGCWKRTAMRACSGANAGTWIAFTGKRAGVIAWRGRPTGVKLTFQATVVVAGDRSLRLRAPVTVEAASAART